MPKVFFNFKILVVLASAAGIYLLGSAVKPNAYMAKAGEQSLEKGTSIAAKVEGKSSCTSAVTKVVKTDLVDKSGESVAGCSVNAGDRGF